MLCPTPYTQNRPTSYVVNGLAGCGSEKKQVFNNGLRSWRELLVRSLHGFDARSRLRAGRRLHVLPREGCTGGVPCFNELRPVSAPPLWPLVALRHGSIR
jgi:hypothetical protein